jgi:ubiquinone/menaquinone biosynthesis C-methylase UbiE
VAADKGLYGVLDALDSAENYRGWILALSSPYLVDAETILEVGAGHGTFTTELSRSAQVTAMEIGADALERLTERFRDSDAVAVTDVSLGQLAASSSDVAFLSNVLEHIEDDVQALRDLARVVRPGGSVIVFSPAFRLLYSRFDASIGHHHRYRLRELVAKFERAGLDVREARYVNSLGFFSWLILVRLLRMTPERSALVRIFDRWFVPVLRKAEALVRPPFGQSVFVVGRVVAAS